MQTADAKKEQPLNPLAYLLMSGHICVDMAQGGIAAAIPFLVVQSGFTYAEATLLVLASNIASAVIQPLFGAVGDRSARPWLMAAGVALAGLGMAGIGLLQGYWLIVASALVSGVGNAMLHPEGGRLAYLVGGERKAETMSIFSVGGQIGFCVGPIVTVAAIVAFGMPGMAVFVALCLPVSFVLLAFNSRFAAFGLREDAGKEGVGRDRWGLFSLVLGACSVRSVVFYGITSFVPLVLVASFAQTEEFASSMITLFAAAGAVATLASGRVSRHIRTPRLMVACFVVLLVALAAFTASPSLALSLAMLMVLAAALNLFNPPAVALGQGFLPQHLGTASGLTFGVAVAVGGVAAPLLGLVGDSNGLSLVMWILVGATLLGLVASLALAALTK